MNAVATPAAQLTAFIARFEPAVATVIRGARTRMRRILPTAHELVYDNYNFFVIGYCASLRPSDCIVSIAAAANGVGLSFYHGADVPDPQHLLQGSGKQNRFIRLATADVLDQPAVRALISSAVAITKTPLPAKATLVIRSISAKQRPRRR
jgi:hypothetical protein